MQQGEGTVPAPSDEAVEAAARRMWDDDEAANARNSAEQGHGLVTATAWGAAHELDHAEYRGSALAALTAAYAIDMPRREAGVRAEERAATLRAHVEFLRELAGITPVYIERPEFKKAADALAAHFNPEAER